MPILRVIFGFILAVLILAAPQGVVFASPPEPVIPPGFYLISATLGAQLYQKDYPQGTPDYVQVIDLSLGAAVVPLHGPVVEPRSGKGVYGGNDARFGSQKIQKYWQQLANTHSTAFCVTNGQFFYMPESPTRLPFPLKKDGVVLTDGYGIKDFPGQKLMLEIWPDQVNIRALTPEDLYNSSAPHIIAGLSEEANKRAKRYVGRTFVGSDDRDGDGKLETMYIFSTRSASQVDAAEVLRSFGAKQVMMLDGGGSAQLVCQNQLFINTDRFIPQALGVIAGSGPELSATPLEITRWPVLVQGEPASLQIELRNTGMQTWKVGEDQLLLAKGDWGETEPLPLPIEAPPGGRSVFAWEGPAFEETGVYTATWTMVRGSQPFEQQPVAFGFIILPLEQADLRQDLQQRLDQWVVEGRENIDLLAQNWIQDQLQRQAEPPPATATPEPEPAATFLQPAAPLLISLSNVIWIPLSILPVAMLLFLVISRIQQNQ